MPQTDIGPVIVGFNERVGRTVVIRAKRAAMSAMEKNVVSNFVIVFMLFHAGLNFSAKELS